MQHTGPEFGPLPLKARSLISVCYSDKTSAEPGKVYHDPIALNSTVTTGREQIPFVLLDENSTQGLYLGCEWELGGIMVSSSSAPLKITAAVMPITENVTRQGHETFTVPTVYYGPYHGDINDGSNQFKKLMLSMSQFASLRTFMTAGRNSVR